jgi:hypothetical protein
MHVLACCLQLASQQQEQVRFHVLAALGKGEPSRILPCGFFHGHLVRALKLPEETSKRLAALQETHNCKPFPMLVHETRKESLYMP